MVQEARGPHREGLQQDPEGEVPVGHRHDHGGRRGVHLLEHLHDPHHHSAVVLFSPFQSLVGINCKCITLNLESGYFKS